VGFKPLSYRFPNSKKSVGSSDCPSIALTDLYKMPNVTEIDYEVVVEMLCDSCWTMRLVLDPLPDPKSCNRGKKNIVYHHR